MSTRVLVPLLLAISLAVGCTYRGHRHHPDPSDPPPHGAHRGHGPPPHAPAHGHRAKLDGRDLEFDEHRGIYAVVGLHDLFWHAGWYHRRLGDRWQRSHRWDGPWYDSRWDDVPPGLRGSGPGKSKGKGKGKGKKPH